MARPKGSGKPKAAPKETSAEAQAIRDTNTALRAVFQFIALGAKKESLSPNQTHCIIQGNYVSMFNGVQAFGAVLNLPSEKQFTCSPHIGSLLAAINQCRSTIEMTVNARQQLVIRSGKFLAHVPCLANDILAPPNPTPPIAPLNEKFFESLYIVGQIASETAERLVEATVFARNGSAVATDGIILFEHWNGNSVPDMSLPKASVQLLSKIAEPKVTSFGATWNPDGRTESVTFWFQNGSWFKTQCYVEPWPEIDNVLSIAANPWPIPVGFWEALHDVSEFAGETDTVILQGKQVRTHEDDGIGAISEIEGAFSLGTAPRVRLNMERLLMFERLVDQVDFASAAVKFQGNNFRGYLSKYEEKEAAVADA